jgi:Raf kinase inhibitor-like YbhB/YbcL family protein
VPRAGVEICARAFGIVPAPLNAMGIAHEVSVAAGHAIQGVRAGAGKLASHRLADGLAPSIEVHSIAFNDDTDLPISCTADGVGAPPPLAWHGAPEAAKSMVVICEDPDAPALEPFLHWLVYGMPGVAQELDAQSQHIYRLGKNSRDQVGFTPAAPPAGHGVHHYHFQVFALDTAIELSAAAERDAVIDAMKGHVLGWGELVGTYQRE